MVHQGLSDFLKLKTWLSTEKVLSRMGPRKPLPHTTAQGTVGIDAQEGLCVLRWSRTGFLSMWALIDCAEN